MNTVITQALATGLPVVATRHSGFPEQVIEGKNGYLAPEANPEAIARAMAEYIEHPEIWGAMSVAARKHALEHYDQAALIDRQVARYREVAGDVKRVAFVVGAFPAVSETFIINQVADLLDRGIDVTIFSFAGGETENISERYTSYRMRDRTKYLSVPNGVLKRVIESLPLILRLFRARPRALLSACNVFRWGREALSLKLLFWSTPFALESFDLVHCHFGTMAKRFLRVADILDIAPTIVTTFYGYDVSQIVKQKGPSYYDRLKERGACYFTMSENMKDRVVALGFDAEKVESLPVSIDVASYPFAERSAPSDGIVRIVSVGRFVEKKGFDDLLRALAHLRKMTDVPFRCSIIGGPKKDEDLLKELAEELHVSNIVEWKGYMKIEDVITFFMQMHLYVQTSKTAKNGDME